jgi:hypothetical protein
MLSEIPPSAPSVADIEFDPDASVSPPVGSVAAVDSVALSLFDPDIVPPPLSPQPTASSTATPTAPTLRPMLKIIRPA